MSMKRFAMAAGATAAATIAAVVAIRASGPAPVGAEEHSERTNEIAGIETQLTELRRSIATVEHQARTAAPPASGPVPAPPSSDEAAPPPSDPAQPTAAQIRDGLERRFFDEEEDPVWRDKATALAYRRLAAIPPGTVVREVACRRTFCRIETAHADRAAFQSFVAAAFLSPDTQLWNGGFAASLVDEAGGGSPSDGVRAVAYLAREGETLPSPEELMAAR